MKQLIQRLHQARTQRRAQAASKKNRPTATCNYADNYYGDQVCRNMRH